MAWNAWKRCCKKVDSQGEHLKGIHDRFLRDPVYRESPLAIGWSEQKCKGRDELVQEDHTYKLTPEERRRYKKKTKQAKVGLWNIDLITEPLSWWKTVYTTNQEKQLNNLSMQVNEDEYNRDKKFSPKITSPTPKLTNTQDESIGLHRQVPRGGTHLNGVGVELTFFNFAQISFCYSRFHLQLIAIHCNQRCVWTDTFILVHTSHCGSRCRTTCLQKHVHPHVITCRSVCCFLVMSSSSRASTLSLTSTCSLFWTSTPIMSTTPSIKPKMHPQNEEYCPVAIYNPSHTRRRFSQPPRAWGFHLAHESFLKALRNSVDFLHGQPFDHLAHDRVLGSFNLVVAKFLTGLQYPVYCDVCVATFLCELLISFLHISILRRALLNPKRTRKIRSMALERYTTFSHKKTSFKTSFKTSSSLEIPSGPWIVLESTSK